MSALTETDFSGVIFDMDGTLIDSTPAVVRSWTTWAIEYGFTEEDMQDFFGVPARSIVAQLLPAEQRQEALARVADLELNDVAGIVPLPGAIEALGQLPVTAIATSSSRELAWRRIEAAGLPAPDVVVTADDVAEGKPNPEPFLLAARRLGIDPVRSLVVEDAAAGIQAGRAAGAKTLALLTTTAPDKLRAADLVVNDLSDVAWQVNDKTAALSIN